MQSCLSTSRWQDMRKQCRLKVERRCKSGLIGSRAGGRRSSLVRRFPHRSIRSSLADRPHTRPSVKDLITLGPGVKYKDWDVPVPGRILVVRSELGEPACVSGTLAVLFTYILQRDASCPPFLFWFPRQGEPHFFCFRCDGALPPSHFFFSFTNYKQHYPGPLTLSFNPISTTKLRP